MIIFRSISVTGLVHRLNSKDRFVITIVIFSFIIKLFFSPIEYKMKNTGDFIYFLDYFECNT